MMGSAYITETRPEKNSSGRENTQGNTRLRPVTRAVKISGARSLMSCLLTNLPTMKVWVRKEYLRDLKDGHIEFVEEYGSLPRVYLVVHIILKLTYPNMGRFLISCQSVLLFHHQIPTPDLDLPNLQFWNCMDYHVTTIVKSIVASMEWECRTRHFGSIKGQYICTLDNYHRVFRRG